MKCLVPVLFSFLALPAAVAENAPSLGTKATAPAQSRWVFSLFPKAFQNNPNLDMTVVTEVTEEGKKLPPVSPEHPAYYIPQPTGYVQMGDTSTGDKPLEKADVERLLKKSLATNGYLAADPPEHAPTIVVVYTWGTHNLINPDDESRSPDQVARNVLDRAALVGGEKFAQELARLFRETDAMVAANPPARTDPSGTVDVMQIDPALDAARIGFANPVNQYKLKNPKNEFVVDQAVEDCYYVVASAFEYAAIAKGQKKLLWRTRMTVGAKGVSQVQSMPAVIAAAAPYFGRDMPEAEVMIKPAREGRIEIGTPTVVELPSAAPAKK